MFFFVLLSTVMFFFCLYFYFSNKKLKQRVEKLELETKEILERKIINNKEDLVSIKNISIETKSPSIEDKSRENIKIDNHQKEIIEKEKTKKTYVARTNNEYKKPTVKSPTEPLLNKIEVNSSLELTISKNFNPSDFIKTIDSNTKKELENDDYLKTISKQIADELAPQTIELTDYEKDQEEHAIISYQELVSLKDGLKSTVDEEDFIENLKEFRKLLD